MRWHYRSENWRTRRCVIDVRVKETFASCGALAMAMVRPRQPGTPGEGPSSNYHRLPVPFLSSVRHCGPPAVSRPRTSRETRCMLGWAQIWYADIRTTFIFRTLLIVLHSSSLTGGGVASWPPRTLLIVGQKLPLFGVSTSRLEGASRGFSL